jgi:hypothetical protein
MRLAKSAQYFEKRILAARARDRNIDFQVADNCTRVLSELKKTFPTVSITRALRPQSWIEAFGTCSIPVSEVVHRFVYYDARFGTAKLGKKPLVETYIKFGQDLLKGLSHSPIKHSEMPKDDSVKLVAGTSSLLPRPN